VLQNNKEGSLRQLTPAYEKIIEVQREVGMVEKAHRPCVDGREFYISQNLVVQATKLQIVYDASASMVPLLLMTVFMQAHR